MLDRILRLDLRATIVLSVASCLSMVSTACTANPPPLFQELQVAAVLEPLPLDRPDEWEFLTTRKEHALKVTLASPDPRSLTALVEGHGARGPARVVCLFSRDGDDIRCRVQAGRITDSFPPPGVRLEYTSVELQSAEVRVTSLDWQAGATVGVSFRLVADDGRLIRGFVKGVVVGPDPPAPP